VSVCEENGAQRAMKCRCARRRFFELNTSDAATRLKMPLPMVRDILCHAMLFAERRLPPPSSPFFSIAMRAHFAFEARFF